MTEHVQVAETVTPLDDAISRLEAQFAGAVRRDDREGYSGVIVDPGKLVEVATFVRDTLGFSYLSSATAVDYLGKSESDHLEMVYHTYNVQGGPALVLKAQTPRSEATLPSLVGVWPGANFQEREAWDLMGIHFAGHPHLKRILMWEGFHGHPLRKDWHEAYYEQDTKPFDSRWPEGHVSRAEECNLYGKNVSYPAGFTLDDYESQAEKALYEGAPMGVHVTDMATDQGVVSMGPQHPSTHGVFRMIVTLNGETIVALEPVMGYLHRNHDKIGERNTFLHNMPFTDRLDYSRHGQQSRLRAGRVEQLMALGKRYEPPTYRAEAIRAMVEHDVSSTTWWPSASVNDPARTSRRSCTPSSSAS